MKITNQMCQNAYPIMKEVWNGNLRRNEAKILINQNSGMSEGSAQAYITIFLSMMEGKEYKRAFNNYGNTLLFDSINNEYGKYYLINALDAAQKHVDYYSTLNKGNLKELQNIINRYRREHMV